MTRDNTLETEIMTWRDIEDLQVCEMTEDPDHIFTADPETLKTWRSEISDPESVSLYLQYGSKIKRYRKDSDPRLRDLRKIENQRPRYEKRSTREIRESYYRRYPDRRPEKTEKMTPDQFNTFLHDRLTRLLSDLEKRS